MPRFSPSNRTASILFILAFLSWTNHSLLAETLAPSPSPTPNDSYTTPDISADCGGDCYCDEQPTITQEWDPTPETTTSPAIYPSITPTPNSSKIPTPVSSNSFKRENEKPSTQLIKALKKRKASMLARSKNERNKSRRLTALAFTLEVIYESDTSIAIIRSDLTRVRYVIPKGEIINKVVQYNSPSVDKAIGSEFKQAARLAKKSDSWRILWKGGIKFAAITGIFHLAATAGPAFAQSLIPDVCVALNDPDRGDACKEVVNWIGNAALCANEFTCEDCYNASLNKFPTRSAETCRATETEANYDVPLQRHILARAGICAAKKGGAYTRPHEMLTMSGVTPPSLADTCPFR